MSKQTANPNQEGGGFGPLTILLWSVACWFAIVYALTLVLT